MASSKLKDAMESCDATFRPHSNDDGSYLRLRNGSFAVADAKSYVDSFIPDLSDNEPFEPFEPFELGYDYVYLDIPKPDYYRPYGIKRLNYEATRRP